MEAARKITRKNLLDLLERLSRRSRVYVPYAKGERLALEPFDPARASSIEFGRIRQDQPLKSFLLAPRKEVSAPSEKGGTVIVAGVKACDLASLAIQDYVFLQGDYRDPFYGTNRENLFIISCDCTAAAETCFCAAMGGRPYPEKGFDVNLSPVGDEFVAEAGSAKGEALFNEFRSFFAHADGHDVTARDGVREKVSGEVERHIAARQTPRTAELGGVVAKHYDSPLWKEMYATCVECGACNLACPTCHCFLLFDEHKEGMPARFMEWDACLYKRFARVAGGANPRRYLWERLRNRFEKKFDYFPAVLKTYACTGCGRCIGACPGDIDIREVLKGLVKGEWAKPPHK